jgi:hypothetical protein
MAPQIKGRNGAALGTREERSPILLMSRPWRRPACPANDVVGWLYGSQHTEADCHKLHDEITNILRRPDIKNLGKDRRNPV